MAADIYVLGKYVFEKCTIFRMVGKVIFRENIFIRILIRHFCMVKK